MKISLLIISLIGYLFFLVSSLRIKFTSAPFIYICSSVVTLYFFALFGFLETGRLFFLWIGIFQACYFAAKYYKRTLFKINNLYYLLFLVPYILLYFLISDNFLFTGWDEFSFWGSSIKIIFETNSLYLSNSPIPFKDYPPAQQLFQYFFLKNTFWSEKNVLFAQGIFVLSALMSVSGLIVKRLSTSALLFYTTCICLYFFGHYDLAHIYVDPLLAVCFAACFMFALTYKNTADVLCFYISIFVLVLIKEIGLILALVPFPVFVYRQVVQSKHMEHNFRKTISVLASSGLYFFSILLAYASWQFYVAKIGASKSIVIPGITDFVSGPGSERLTLTVTEFIRRITMPSNTFHISILTVAAAFTLAGLLIVYLQKKHRVEAGICFFSLSAGFAGYMIFLLFCYLVFFTEYEGIRLASFERYLSTYMLAWFLIFFSYIVATVENVNSRLSKLFILIAFVTSINMAPTKFMDDFKGITPPAQLADSRKKVELLSEKVKKHLHPGEKVYFIYQNSTGFEKNIFNYTMLPFRTTGWCWSLGKKYFDGDVWTCPNKLGEVLKDYDYLAVYYADEQFWKDNQQLFEPSSLGHTTGVFKVNRKGAVVLSLSEVG